MFQQRKPIAFLNLFLILMLVLTACVAENEQLDTETHTHLSPSGSAPAATIEDDPPSTTETSATQHEHSQDTQNQTNDTTSSGLLHVHFIDVGQGASQLLIGPTGRTMLIDAGDNHKEQFIVHYLKNQGITKIDILIGTHPHADHIGGMDAVIDAFEIGQIYMPRVQTNTKTFEDVLLAIQRKNLKVNTAKAGVRLDWEPEIDAQIIAPIKEYENINDMSAVVHLTYGETSFLFTGDAESTSEQDMVRSGANLKADVLHVGHHGSSTSTTSAFLKKVDPTYAVIQVGDNNYGHPHKEVMNRLQQNNIKIFRNDEQGHIIFQSDGKQLTVSQQSWEATTPATQPPQVDKQPEANQPPENNQPLELSVTSSVDQKNPKQNSTVTVTVNVHDQHNQPVQGAKVVLTLHYKTTQTTYEGTTDASGTAHLPFRIGRASKGFEVIGEIKVTYENTTGQSRISFTPQ